ncbi:hypothetical protein [uncultured Acetobacteroides sp.]|uniref:hypothetical protein n=1 Tax=uncultured Acetobacteroides sp. TaxID=1760811 RepID=UPI0029F4E27F|nr:hypothetical protein [uncultured Acetobacteroides sp.]
MNKRIANIARMLRTTADVLNQNKDKWATLAVLATTVPGFLELVEKIDPAMLESEKEISAPSADKETIREGLEEETFLLAMALRSLGNFEKNTTLTEATSFSESNLKNMMEDTLVTTAKKVIGLGKENVKKLAGYGIVEADLTRHEEMIAQFSTIQTIPRSKLVDRKAAKEALVEVVDAAKERLTEQIDLQMELLRRREPAFYSAYQSARKIVDIGIRHEKKDPKKAEAPNTDEAAK